MAATFAQRRLDGEPTARVAAVLVLSVIYILASTTLIGMALVSFAAIPMITAFGPWADCATLLLSLSLAVVLSTTISHPAQA